MPTNIKEEIDTIANIVYTRHQSGIEATVAKHKLIKDINSLLHSHSQELIERINNKYASMDDKDLREEIIRLVEN